jgi:hypothetical protein
MDKQQQEEIEDRALILLDHLVNGSAKRQQYVKSALSEMLPDEAVHTILYWLIHGKRVPETWYAAFGVVAVYSTFLVPFVFRSMDWKFYIAPIVLPLVAGALMKSVRSNAIQTRCYEFLVNYDDARITNVLVQAFAKALQPNVKVKAAHALTKLLNKIKPSDAAHVSRQSRKVLTEMLLNTKNAPFVLSILAAWEQIGEAQAIPVVERLSHGEGMAGGYARVREAACLAIPAILAAAERAAVADVLLRPSESGAFANDLLRPAQSSHDNSTPALLYPTSPLPDAP